MKWNIAFILLLSMLSVQVCQDQKSGKKNKNYRGGCQF
jgi:hypothetical protein